MSDHCIPPSWRRPRRYRALYRQVVYDRVPVGRRGELHEAIGLRQEVGYGAQAWEHAAELAEHFGRGRDAVRAVHYHQLAAATALRRWAYHEAIRHLSRGLAHLQRRLDTPERTQQELALQRMLGPAVMLTRGFAAPEVERVYRRALELCQQMGDTPHLFPVLAGLRECLSVQGQSQAAYDLGEQLLTLAQQAQDPTLLLQAHQALGGTLYYRGELVAAHFHLEQGLGLYRPEEHRADAVRSDQDPGLACVRYAALTLWLLGYPDQALQRSQQALALARASQHPPSLAAALVFAARVHQHRGEGPLAREQAEVAMTFAREQGFTQRLAAATIVRGWALAMQGQVDAGIAAMQEGLTAFRATGAADDLPYWLALLAEGYRRGDQAAEALRLVSEALAIARSHGLRVWEAELRGLQGELRRLEAAEQGSARHEAAEAEAAISFRQALDIAHQQEAKSLELRAAIRLCRLWQSQGKHAQARQLVADIYGWFTEGFDTADLREAKALLPGLS